MTKFHSKYFAHGFTRAGPKMIDRLSVDLKEAFPEMNGFSSRNLKYMRKFVEAWGDREFVQRTVAQIPWRSNLTLLEKLKDPQIEMLCGHRTQNRQVLKRRKT